MTSDPWELYQQSYARVAERWLPMFAWHELISRDSVRNFILGTGDLNSRWLASDPVEAPPGYLYGFHPADDWNVIPTGLGSLLALERLHWYAPFSEGTYVEARSYHAPLKVSPSKRFGEVLDQNVRIVFADKKTGRVLAERTKLVKIFRRPETDRPAQRGAPSTAYVYSDAEIREIEECCASERITWPEKRPLSSVKPTERLGKIARGPLTVTDTMAFVAGVGEPQVRSVPGRYNYVRKWPHLLAVDPVTKVPDIRARFHWDSSFAQSFIGTPAFDFVSQRTCWVAQLLTNWLGSEAYLAELSVRAGESHYLGDTAWISGEVVSTNESSAEIQIEIVNQEKKATTSGTALVSYEEPVYLEAEWLSKASRQKEEARQ